MKRKYLRWVAGLMAVALLGGGVACSKQQPKPKVGEHTVSADGGTYTYDDGITIAAPKGAIQQDAKLAVTKPQQRPADDAPLGAANNAAFDVSFDGNLQPADGKPLELRVPLRGNLLPQGYKPNQALFYHRLPDGKGYRLMSHKLDGDELVAKLPHLSEWQLVWLGDDEFRTLSGIDEISPVKRDGCKTEVEGKSAGKVRISDKTGWTDKSGPIKACLYVQNGEAHLSVANRTQYMLSVAATGGLKIGATSKGATQDAVAALAKQVAGPKVKGFLGRESELAAKLTSSNVPATMQFRAEPNTFLAEALWFGISLLTSIVVGQNPTKAAEQIKAVIDAPEVLDCLRANMSTAMGKEPSFWDVFGMVTGKCGQMIAEALGAGASWMLWDRAFTLIDVLKNGWSSLVAAYDGIRLTLAGTISVTVSPVAPACLSASEFERVVKADSANYKRVIVERDYGITCASGWAAATITAYPDLPPPMDQAVGFAAVLQWQRGAWKMVDAGQDMSEGYTCRNAPQRIRSSISCR